MSHIIEVIEVEGKPAVVQLPVTMGEPFALYLLPDEEEEGLRDLRQTVLRRADHDPPKGSLLLLEVTLQDAPGRGSGAAFRIGKVGSQARLYLSAPEGRSRVSRATRLDWSSKLEVTVKNRRGVTIVLRQLEAGGSGLSRSAGGGTKRSTAISASAAKRWHVPTFPMLLRVPWERVTKVVVGIAKRFGLSASTLALVVGAGIIVVGMAYTAYVQYQARMEMEEEAKLLAEAVGASEAAEEAARESEARCLDERQDLVQQLDDQMALWQLWAEEALMLSLSRSISIERGGGRMANDAVTAHEDPEALRDRVVVEMRTLRGGPKDASQCSRHKNQLGKDLPGFLLMWHPDPELVCPEDYVAVVGGVARAGRWGISDRVAAEFGPALGGSQNDAGEAVDDYRLIDRWSAKTLSRAMRDIQTAILGAETRSRPPVAPAELHLWAATFMGAYNSMPTPAEGVMNAEAGQCVQDVIEDLAQASGAAEAGKPVLPPLLAVALGEENVALVPTAGCPWPTGDGIKDAAKSALRAVAHTAKLKGEEEQEESG